MKKVLICMGILMCVAVGVFANHKSESKNVELEKGLSEVSFIQNQMVTIFNKYLRDEYLLEDGRFSWELLNEDFDVARTAIDVILIDFASLQVPSKTIVDFENSFSELENYIYEADVNKFIRKVCDIYNLTSYSILDNMSEDEEIKLEKKAKSDLLYCGYYIKTLNKEFALSNLDVFQENYKNLSINKKYVENNSYKINKIFINSQKLKDEINNEDFQMAINRFVKILELI